jgi:hypothetical protein
MFHLRRAREAAEAQCMSNYGLLAAFAGPLHKDLESEIALQACVALLLMYSLLLFFILLSIYSPRLSGLYQTVNGLQNGTERWLKVKRPFGVFC